MSGMVRYHESTLAIIVESSADNRQQQQQLYISLINRRRFKIRSLNDQKETQNETSCVGKRFGKSEQSKYNTQDLSGNAKGKVERIYSCVEWKPKQN